MDILFISFYLYFLGNQKDLGLNEKSAILFNNIVREYTTLSSNIVLTSSRTVNNLIYKYSTNSSFRKIEDPSAITVANADQLTKKIEVCTSEKAVKLEVNPREKKKPKPTEPPVPRSVALPHTHAHNDYEHEYPLLNALSYGFVSVEADIWLYPDDEENLRVAHYSVEEPKALPTLEELYLDPLQDLKEKLDNGGIYADGTPLTLLIDIKSKEVSTYERLDEILTQYEARSPGLLTNYTQDESGNYIVTPGAVTVIISGNRPRKLIESQKVRYADYDGRKPDIGTDVTSGFMPLISDNWNKFFSDDLAWDGTGAIPLDTKAELNKIISKVQEEDKIFRFWNLPQDSPNVWSSLYEAGVDLINTDNLEGLSRFIESQMTETRKLLCSTS